MNSLHRSWCERRRPVPRQVNGGDGGDAACHAHGFCVGLRGAVRIQEPTITGTPSWLGRRMRADDADELVFEVAQLADSSVDPLHKTAWILGVLSAGNDARVWLTLPMKAFEIGIIVREDGATVGRGIRKDLGAVNALVGPPSFLHGPHVVPELAQRLDDRQREVLIGIEPGHTRSVRLVLANVLVDFRAMLSVVIPGRLEVFGC